MYYLPMGMTGPRHVRTTRTDNSWENFSSRRRRLPYRINDSWNGYMRPIHRGYTARWFQCIFATARNRRREHVLNRRISTNYEIGC